MSIKTIISLLLLPAILSCSSKIEENSSGKKDTLLQNKDSGVAYNRTDNLFLSIPDTIKKSASYFFSNSQTKDLFLLTIEPGMVKNSKSSLQIITADGTVIYTQSFDTYYFIKSIYEPNSLPANIDQEGYEKFIERYWKSITAKQYEVHFKKSVDTFFDALFSIEKNRYAELKNWEEDINDKDFLQEVTIDTTIYLYDVLCFDCDEGGTIIGYSKKRNKVILLVEHD